MPGRAEVRSLNLVRDASMGRVVHRSGAWLLSLELRDTDCVAPFMYVYVRRFPLGPEA